MQFYKTINKRANSSRLVLILPGYTGGSGAFSSILPLFSSDVVSITYPGHGEHFKDFSSTTSKDWEQSVIDIISMESEKYEDILLVGYSMGGALTLLYGQGYPKLLLAPAVINKAVVPEDDKCKKPITLDAVNPKLKAMCDDEDIEALQWFLKYDDHQSQVELNKLETKANKITRTEFANTYAFIGEKDPVIPFSKAQSWLKAHNIEVLGFKESTHAILYDDHADEVIKAIKILCSRDERLKKFTE